MWDTLVERMVNHPILPRKDILALTRQIAEGNQIDSKAKTEAKEKLFTHLLRRVAQIADHFYIKRVHFFGKFCNFDDLFSEGTIALWKTINKIGLDGGYDPDGEPFILYASKFICLKIKSYLARKNVRGVFSGGIKVEMKEGRRDSFPLDPDDSDLVYEDLALESLPDDEEATIVRLEREGCRLTKRERLIINEKYPNSGGKGKSLRTMATEAGFSGAAFNQSHARALNKIRFGLIKKYPKTFSHAK